MTEGEVKAVVDGIAPVLREYVDRAVADVLARLGVVEVKAQMSDAAAAAIVGVIADGTKEYAALRERVAVLEAKPPGADGAPGKDGRDGKDGAPGLRYLGVYQDGKAYATGDVVTWGGSAWHCHDATDSKPGTGSAAWQLMVKHGRDAKEGRQA